MKKQQSVEMKNKKNIIVFLTAWLILQVLTIVIIVSYFISTTPNWLEKKHCVEWNYSCIETCKSDRLCEPDLDCCERRQLELWRKITVYSGISGLGINIFLAILVTQYVQDRQKKMNIHDQKLYVLIDLIFSSERALPARYTSNGDRTMSFCIDLDELTEDDESAMASFPWSAINEYYPKLSQEQQDLVGFHIVLKQSEDIIIGAFANQVMFDSEIDAEELITAIIEENLDILEENKVEVSKDFRAVIYSEPIQAFYRECYDYAKQRAVSHE